MRKGSVSQREIAKRLGIARSTVSYALRNSPHASPDVRRKVHELCRELNYRPNAHARSLRMARSDLVGVATGLLSNPFHARFVQLLIDELSKSGYGLMVRTFGGSQDEMRDRVLEFLDRRACGVILQGIHPNLYDELRVTLGEVVPLVMNGPTRPGVPSVGCNYDQAGQTVAEHLISLGHRRLAAFVNALEVQAGVRAKVSGFYRTIREAGLPAPTEILVPAYSETLNRADLGVLLAQELEQQCADADAVFCANDEEAIALVCRLTDQGVRVPEDLAVVGFDDIPEAQTLHIPITTIRQPVEEYARQAVRMLLAQLDPDRPFTPEAIAINCELMVRSSTVAGAGRGGR